MHHCSTGHWIARAHRANQAASTLFRRASLAEYYYKTMKADLEACVKSCHQCQIHASKAYIPRANQKLIITKWTLVSLGIDIVGPMPKATWCMKWILVAINHLSKYVEAVAIGSITTERIIEFVWNHLITRFGVPKRIIAENGMQFRSKKFIEFCKGLKIKNRYSSVAHARTNG